MKKLVFLLAASSTMAIPVVGMSAGSICTPYKNVSYALQTSQASGTLTKSQICNQGNYNIIAQIDVKKLFISKQITQNAAGTYTSNGISAKMFTITNSDGTTATQLSSGKLDTLSLVLYLSNSLSSNTSFSDPVWVWYNNTINKMSCTVTNTNASVTTGSNQSLSATQVTCATPDNSTLVLSYLFSQDVSPMMLSATATESGTQTLSAVIN